MAQDRNLQEIIESVLYAWGVSNSGLIAQDVAEEVLCPNNRELLETAIADQDKSFANTLGLVSWGDVPKWAAIEIFDIDGVPLEYRDSGDDKGAPQEWQRQDYSCGYHFERYGAARYARVHGWEQGYPNLLFKVKT